MSVAKVIELVGKSTKSWEDAVQQAVKEAENITKKDIKCVDIKRMTANIKNGKLAEYKVDVKVLFVI